MSGSPTSRTNAVLASDVAVERLFGQIESTCASMNAAAATIERIASERDAMFQQLRVAWEAGFQLARAYGDNHAHFDGEQKERQWALALERLATWTRAPHCG